MNTPEYLSIAEIRGTIHNRSGQYPMRLQGARRNNYFFHPGKDGKLTRRYVFGDTDSNLGTYPIADAPTEMLDLQRGVNKDIAIVWEFVTVEQWMSEKVAALEYQSILEQSNKDRLEQLETARLAKEEAEKKVAALSHPITFIPPAAVEDAPAVKPARKTRPKVLETLETAP